MLLGLSSISLGQQDSCVVFGDAPPQIQLMGFITEDYSPKNINYVVHIHHTDSSIYDYSYISDDIIWDAHEHLNEEFEEASFTFDLHGILYHDLDELEGGQELLAQYNTCIPYSYYGWTTMENYLEPLIWDQDVYMNVHVFPQFCAGILGFAWTAQADTPFDGVWIRSNVFGRFGDHLWGDRNQNKTMIHEVGHFLGLQHVFKSVDFCGQDLGPCEETGDYVCDTPPIKTTWSCANPICPPAWPEYQPWADYIHDNHMDYYVDSCRQHFTSGQIERMHIVVPITRPNIIDTDDDDFCIGDITGDYVVGTNDLLACLDHWGQIDWIEGDINGDGFFTVTDFTIMLSQYGTVCLGAELDPFYREEKLELTKTESVRSLLDLLNKHGIDGTRSN